MKTAGGVDYCDICSGSLGTLQCVVGHGCRVAAKFLLDYGHSGTLTPYVKLLDGGGTECIGGTKHHLIAGFLEL